MNTSLWLVTNLYRAFSLFKTWLNGWSHFPAALSRNAEKIRNGYIGECTFLRIQGPSKKKKKKMKESKNQEKVQEWG